MAKKKKKKTIKDNFKTDDIFMVSTVTLILNKTVDSVSSDRHYVCFGSDVTINFKAKQILYSYNLDQVKTLALIGLAELQGYCHHEMDFDLN